jgi:hypothetical protein
MKEAAENSQYEMRPQGLKPGLISGLYAALEAPLFHGTFTVLSQYFHGTFTVLPRYCHGHIKYSCVSPQPPEAALPKGSWALPEAA